ncbi:MAG: YfhO family protein, partial [Clostridiaceae bacterium]|nr:YfhO family protein [Clostridiaceae bacterium]
IFLVMMPVLLALLAVCTFCLIVPDFRNRFSLVRSDLPDVLCFLGAYWLVLLVMRHRNLSTILTVMLPLVCIEVILLNWSAVNHRRSLTSIPSSSDLQGNRYIYAGAFDFLKQREEGKGFSRFYLPSVDIYSLVNMPSYYFYPGQTTYNSFIDKSNFDFYKSLGVDGIQHSSKVLIGMKDRFILHSLLGTKYFLSPDEINYPGVRFVKEVDGVNIFENPYAVPLGVVYQNCISTHDWLKLSPAQREALLTEVVVLDGCLDTKGDHLKQLETKLVDIPHSMQHLIDTGIVGYLRGSEIRASANLEKAGTAVFSIPFNKGWRAWVNDKEQEIVRANGGLIGLPLSAGNVEIVLSFRPPHLKVGVAVSLISLILLFWLGFRGRQHPFGK